jgi:hypothetical protein
MMVTACQKKLKQKACVSVDLDALFQSVQTTLEEEKHIVSNSTTNGKGNLARAKKIAGIICTLHIIDLVR